MRIGFSGLWRSPRGHDAAERSSSSARPRSPAGLPVSISANSRAELGRRAPDEPHHPDYPDKRGAGYRDRRLNGNRAIRLVAYREISPRSSAMACEQKRAGCTLLSSTTSEYRFITGRIGVRNPSLTVLLGLQLF